jgi:DNA-binding CsgD family transcriptional regulator
MQRMNMKKRPRRVGPSAPVAGLSAAVKQASGAPPADLPDLLQQHREHEGKHKAVAKALLDAFAYLPLEKYAAAVRKGRRDTDDLLGVLFEDLGRCIERLAENNIPPEKVEAYIKAELFHSKEHLVMENILSLAPPPSTNVSRDNRGQELYPTPTRVRQVPQTRWEPDAQPRTNPIEDPAYSYLAEAEDGRIAAPSRFNQAPVGKDVEDKDNCICLDDKDNYTFLADVLVKAAKTPLEKTVAGMVLAGHSGNDIARSLKVPRNQITNIIRLVLDRVRRRLRDDEVEKPVAPWTDRPAPDDALDLPVPRSSLAPAGCEAARQAVEQMAV